MKIPTRVLATVVALAALSGCGSGSLPALPSAAGAAGAEDSRQMASGMWAPYSSVHYSLSKDFKDDLPDKATAYELGRTTDANAVDKLARALGIPLAGKVVETKHDWTVGAGGRTLRVTKAGGLPFSLDGEKAVSSGYACAEAQSVPPSAPADQPAEARSGDAARPEAPSEPTNGDDARCAEPAPSPDLPSKAAAVQTARDALRAAGLDMEGAEVTADGGFDSWNVTVQHRVGSATATGLTSSVLIGPKGRILSAYGLLGRPEVLGDYPLVSAAKAVDRLNELQNADGKLRGKPEPADLDDRGPETKGSDQSTGSGGASPRESGETAASSKAPDAPTLVSPRPAECDDATASCAPPSGAPDPTEPAEPETREVVLTKAATILTMVGGHEPLTALHLVPAYSFTDADGGEVQVEAVSDKHLQKPTTKAEPEPAQPVDDGASSDPGDGNDSGNCSAQMPAPTRDGNQPIVLEVCVSPGKARVGQEVTFTIKAKDADGSFAEGPCQGPVVARFGDEGSEDDDVSQCAACASATQGKHEYEKTLTHKYEKPGAYNATFDVRSGSTCDPKPGDSKGTIDIRVGVSD